MLFLHLCIQYITGLVIWFSMMKLQWWLFIASERWKRFRHMRIAPSWPGKWWAERKDREESFKGQSAFSGMLCQQGERGVDKRKSGEDRTARERPRTGGREEGHLERWALHGDLFVLFKDESMCPMFVVMHKDGAEVKGLGIEEVSGDALSC